MFIPINITNGSSAEHPAGETPLRGANPHLSRDAHALANHVRRLVENLSEVTAGFLLDKNRRDQELQDPRQAHET